MNIIDIIYTLIVCTLLVILYKLSGHKFLFTYKIERFILITLRRLQMAKRKIMRRDEVTEDKTPEFEMMLDLSGNTVLAQITKQSEVLRRTNSTAIRFVGSKMSIYSAARPELNNEIYIRGRMTDRDNDYMLRVFSTAEEAMTYYQNVITTLEEWRAAGFKLSSY